MASVIGTTFCSSLKSGMITVIEKLVFRNCGKSYSFIKQIIKPKMNFNNSEVILFFCGETKLHECNFQKHCLEGDFLINLKTSKLFLF